jgi:signal transduction histidine kinase
MRKTLIGGLTIAVLAGMGGLRAADLWRARGERLAAAEQRAANLTIILSEYLSEAFAAGDAALRQLALHSQRVGGPSAPERDWLPSLASARAGIAGIGSISVIDRNGIIRHSTRRDILGQSRADTYISREALNASGDDLIVGNPFKAVVEPFSLLIPIARRLTDAEGAVNGAVVAAFIPAELRNFFQSLNVGAGTVWVFHPDGTVLFREPSAADAIGERALDNPVFAAGTEHRIGVVRAPIARAGPEMLTAYRVSDAPRLMTAVSLDRDEVLAEWRTEAIGVAWVFAGASILLGATLLGLFRQIDANASAERELAQARELEAERLREANERLALTLEREKHTRREAETASALKDQFLMTVSHELRTPLTAIAGWARLLVDGMVSDARRQAALESIERNAQTQTRLIEDLLDVSAIMAGKLSLNLRSVNVADTVTTALDSVRNAAEAKRVELEVSLDAGAGCVQGDPERLEQIVWNLASNAVKFTPAGGRVDVSLVPRDGHVELGVRDTGIGIAPEFLPHVFDYFRQGDSSPSRRHGGLGLGLAIVKSLVELHGGSVTAESAGENQGATFTVRLPAPVRRLA